MGKTSFIKTVYILGVSKLRSKPSGYGSFDQNM